MDSPDALIVSGNSKIAELLELHDTVVIPAYSCQLDGFVNDTFTEYANTSIYRPASVCRSRVVSTLRGTNRCPGKFRFGFTMYTTAGCDECIEIWIGHRKVALAHHPDPDNRVHLFVAPERFKFKSGELIRLVTSANNGPCRIENLVMLSKRPRPSPVELKIEKPHVDVRLDESGYRAFITWTTNRPASGTLKWGAEKRAGRRVRLAKALCCHEIVLDKVERGKVYSYELQLKDRTGNLSAKYSGKFQTNIPSPKSKTSRMRLSLHLKRAASVPAGGWPVSVGVPFPKGVLGSAAEVSAVERDKSEMPCQARAMTGWPDGSVQWALVDFKADGQNDFALEFGSAVTANERDDSLKVVKGRTGIKVSTGMLEVEFPKNQLMLPGRVSLRKPDGSVRVVTNGESPAVTLSEKGSTFISGKPDAVVIEESGTERVCVRIDATHRNTNGRSLFRSVFRIHLFRGSTQIRVQHTFENDRTDEEFTNFHELSLRLGLDVGSEALGRFENQKIEALSKRPVVLQQMHDNRYSLRRGNQDIARGRRFEGFVDIHGESGGVSLAFRDFWQNYPKGLSVDRDGVTIQICPPLEKNAYPTGGLEEDRLYYYLLDGQYKLKRGVARTHEFWLDFRNAGEKADPYFNECVQRPPLYSIDLETFNRSKTITQLPSKAKSPFPPYEEWVEAAREAYRDDREESRAYGMLNYGDWFGERVYNWGNQEYDAAWCYLQEYLRGGHTDFWDWSEQAARHLTDVDTSHYSSDPKEVGVQYAHCVGHTGGYYPDGYRETASFSGHWAVSHTWVEGPLLYHLLSGDTRVLESVMKTCALLIGEKANDYDFTNCRNCGWHLIHLSAAYKVTGRRVFLNVAKVIVERVLERQRDSGGWDRLMVPGHCFCMPPRHTGNAGFMVGILMVGLKRYYEATSDERVADSIVRAAEYCIDSMWVSGRGCFRYTSCPESDPVGSADMRILKGIATAYHFSKKKRFKEVLLAGVQTSMARSRPKAHRGIGKVICSPMRGAPQVLVDLPRR